MGCLGLCSMVCALCALLLRSERLGLEKPIIWDSVCDVHLFLLEVDNMLKWKKQEDQQENVLNSFFHRAERECGVLCFTWPTCLTYLWFLHLLDWFPGCDPCVPKHSCIWLFLFDDFGPYSASHHCSAVEPCHNLAKEPKNEALTDKKKRFIWSEGVWGRRGAGLRGVMSCELERVKGRKSPGRTDVQ